MGPPARGPRMRARNWRSPDRCRRRTAASLLPHGELELPSAVRRRDQVELEGPDLRRVRAQVDGKDFAGSALRGGQRGLDGGQLLELVDVLDDGAGRVLAAGAGSEEPEGRRLAHYGADLELGHVDGAAFLHPERRQADGPDRR